MTEGCDGVDLAWNKVGGSLWAPVARMALAMVTGVVGGLGAILFRLMISWVADGVHLVLPLTHRPVWAWTVLLAPAAGLLAVSLITRYVAREVKGHGVPQILESLALRGGRIRPRVGLFGILAPALTIGSGGSVGREGPIALIGAAFGSTLGQALHLTDQDISLLVGCGAAAGIGATFNAPIAGGFFGLEVVLGTYALGALVPVFLASVTGVTVFTTIMGGGAVLPTPPYHVIDHWAILFMIGLGALVAGVGYLYTAGLTFSEDAFDRLRLPFWAKAVVGGLAVGLIGLFLPGVLGVGYATMHRALDGDLVFGVLALLFVAKYVATLITIGAGGSGGVFAPSLFIGGMFGGFYGGVLHRISPGWAPHPAIYAVAGMAAMFSAAAQAPFVAITILLEITGDYHLTAPVMAAAAVSYFAYGYFTRDSMYTVKLRRRGISILHGNDVRPIEQIAVEGALSALDDVHLGVEDTREQAYNRLMELNRSFLPVVDASGQVVGLATLAGLSAHHGEHHGERPLRDVMLPLPPPLWATDSLDTALRRFALEDVVALPVRRGSRGRLVGFVTRDDVIRAYNASTLRTMGTAQQMQSLSRAQNDPGRFLEVILSARSPIVGQTLQTLRLPAAALVVSLARRNATLIPHGQTRLETGDRLLVYVAPAAEADTVRRMLEGV